MKVIKHHTVRYDIHDISEEELKILMDSLQSNGASCGLDYAARGKISKLYDILDEVKDNG